MCSRSPNRRESAQRRMRVKATTRSDIDGAADPDGRPLRRRNMLADPVAERLANHRVQVGALQPGQFLGNQCHALAPRTMHAGDVGAPEHTSRAERVEHTMQWVVHGAERIEVQRIASLTGRLDRHVRMPCQCQQLRQVAIGGGRMVCLWPRGESVRQQSSWRLAFVERWRTMPPVCAVG